MNYKDIVGTKYKLHGRTLEEGLDCWGVVLMLYKDDGINLPDPVYGTTGDFPQVADKLGSLNSIFKKIEYPTEKCIIMIKVHGLNSHCGVYIGDGYFIHSTFSQGVVIEPVYRYKKRIEGYYKVSDNL